MSLSEKIAEKYAGGMKPGKKGLHRGIAAVCMAWICCAVYVCVRRALWNVNFWVDEAMLAYSVSLRPISALTASMLDWDQSAPVLYLYFVKLITMVLGNSEFSLRLLSLLSYAAALGLTYLLASRVFREKLPLLSVAFLAGTSIFMDYAMEFKPYMTEACVVLFSLYLFYLYRERKLAWGWYILGAAVLIWMSNAICFFAGGVLSYEFLAGVIKKDGKRLVRSIAGGAGVIFSFVLYYFYWLRPVIDKGYMTVFWADYRLTADIGHDWKLLMDMMGHFGICAVPVMVFAGFAVFYFGVIKREAYYVVATFGLMIAAIASAMGMYPMKDRMWLFIYPLLAIFLFHALELLWQETPWRYGVLCLGMGILIFSQTGLIDYGRKETAGYVEKEESRALIQYVSEHIEEGEVCYVYRHALPAFWYENGYANTSIGDYSDNVYFGNDFFERGENAEDIQYILRQEGVYILVSHLNTSASRLNPLLTILNNTGNLELVLNEHNTPLYYYSAKADNIKFRGEMSIEEANTADDICDAVLRFDNLGEAYLNNGKEQVSLQTIDQDRNMTFAINENPAPGETAEIYIQFVWPEDTEEIELYLCRDGQPQMGTQPVRIVKKEAIQ